MVAGARPVAEKRALCGILAVRSEANRGFELAAVEGPSPGVAAPVPALVRYGLHERRLVGRHAAHGGAQLGGLGGRSRSRAALIGGGEGDLGGRRSDGGGGE